MNAIVVAEKSVSARAPKPARAAFAKATAGQGGRVRSPENKSTPPGFVAGIGMPVGTQWSRDHRSRLQKTKAPSRDSAL
jgi:hypothetical protein